MTKLENYKKLFENSTKELEALYFDFLRFPTISADPAYQPELQKCANWLEKQLVQIGFEVEQWNKEQAPVIIASNCKAGSDKPTLLIYNHYDVQPVDPLELWDSPPFEPKKEGEMVIARGAQDNKGQCFYVLAALKLLMRAEGKLPINVKLCIEGQEESGSSALSALLKDTTRHQSLQKSLQADYLLIADVGMKNAHTPAITLGTRGLAAYTIELQGSHTDLHSGCWGGIAYNPLHALVEILSSLRDSSGHITIPGFYDAVSQPSSDELASISLDFDEKSAMADFGLVPTGGEKSFSPLERAWLRPTLELNGITGGYGGPGTKTVIPAKAQAKLSCRLVPNQDPYAISQLIKRHIESLAPAGIEVTCIVHDSMGKPIRTSPRCPLIQALSHACQVVFGKQAEYIYEGASIPITAELQEASHSQVVLFGLGLATDKIHAPNECFGWDRIEKGCLILCETLQTLGQ